MTNKKVPPRRLGRGLDALLPPVATPAANAGGGEGGEGVEGAIVRVDLDRLVPGGKETQPRRHFDEVALGELAESIRRHGVLQPLLVRPHPDGSGRLQIVAGERRWQAAQRAGLATLPVVVREMDDQTALEAALSENLHRENLSAIEEARAYKVLVERYDLTANDIAQLVGKSRGYIANAMRLLELPEAVQTQIHSFKLGTAHARILLQYKDTVLLLERGRAGHIARLAVGKDWTVRQLESFLKREGERAASGGDLAETIKQAGGKEGDATSVSRRRQGAGGGAGGAVGGGVMQADGGDWAKAVVGELAYSLEKKTGVPTGIRNVGVEPMGGRLQFAYRDASELERIVQTLLDHWDDAPKKGARDVERDWEERWRREAERKRRESAGKKTGDAAGEKTGDAAGKGSGKKTGKGSG